MFSTNMRVKRLQSAIEKDGFNQNAHFMLGEEYMREDRPMKAVAKFRRVVELNPDDARAWKMLGEALETARVWKEAAVAYATAAREFDVKHLPQEAEAMRTAAARAHDRINSAALPVLLLLKVEQKQ